ncbi:hypothetical protein [Thalassomonas sp. RHCl1]|uniref:hypothetical protein n=1 Tax=Thalassomonas sp. RHCl1 TaxID=2995320 RepID=UPI00248CA6DD|nr:hypothetical protein [Thalassomonas sp. RHCl1]
MLLSFVFFNVGASESLTSASPATVSYALGGNDAFQVFSPESAGLKPGDSEAIQSAITTSFEPAAGNINVWRKLPDVSSGEKTDVGLQPKTENNAGLFALCFFLFSLFLILRRKYLYLFR